MNDRRGVSARHLASEGSSNEIWRVAIGDNRVQSMTPDQIAHAYRSGQLNERTPLWPPGTSRWQALGSFEEFRGSPASNGGGPGLSSYDEADDDPTRMWTGPAEDFDYEPASAPAAPAPQMRSSSRTGPRLSARPPVSAPAPSRPVASRPAASRPAPIAPPRSSTAAPSVRSMPAEPSRSRGSGLLLVAGLVGLVGVGSAILAARGDLGPGTVAASPDTAPEPAAATTPAETEMVDPPSTETPTPAAGGEAKLAAYDEASAFVQGVAPSKVADDVNPDDDAEDEAKASEEATEPETKPDKPPRTTKSVTTSKAKPIVKKTSRPRKASVTAAPKPKPKPKAVAKPAPKPRVTPKPKPKRVSSARGKSDSQAAAATALARSASLATSCRPRGGPSGPGKARVSYSNDGSVKSVEILTARFRGTLTGSCVRMVFRRAKIPPFKGQPPMFIKSFTIPKE